MPRAPVPSPPPTPGSSAASSKKRKPYTRSSTVKSEKNAPTTENDPGAAPVMTEPTVPVSHDDCLPKVGPICRDILNWQGKQPRLCSTSGHYGVYVSMLLKENITEAVESVVILEDLLAKFHDILADLIEKDGGARRKKMDQLENETASCGDEARNLKQLLDLSRERLKLLQRSGSSYWAIRDLEKVIEKNSTDLQGVKQQWAEKIAKLNGLRSTDALLDSLRAGTGKLGGE